MHQFWSVGNRAGMMHVFSSAMSWKNGINAIK